MLLFGTEVKTCYIIATLPRTGSYLLCEALSNTDIAGYPIEPFSRSNKAMHVHAWGMEKPVGIRNFITELVKRCTTPNGVFGVKIHWEQLRWLHTILRISKSNETAVLDYLFPNATYIHLTRQDVREQAISRFRAETTNEWWRQRDVTNTRIVAPDPLFDSNEIRQWEQTFRRQAKCWPLYFADRKIEPLHITYDDLSRDWRLETKRVLDYIGEETTMVDGLPDTTLVKQADAITRAWKKRLEEEDRKGIIK